MRILWIKTELLHPVDKGGRIRTYQMLRSLSQRHNITYLCLNDGHADPSATTLALEYCKKVIAVPFRPSRKLSAAFFADLLGNLFSTLPYAVSRYQSKDLRSQIEALAHGVDLIVCDFLAPSINVPDGLPAKTVLFQHNVEAMIWDRHALTSRNPMRRAYMCLQWQRMRRFEARECRRFDHVVAVSEHDAQIFRNQYGAVSVCAVNTGVDTAYFRRSGAHAVNPYELVFIGSMDWMPNEDGIRWFAEAVLPLIVRRIPEASLAVVGRSPSAAMQRLAANIPRMHVTGTVPDVRPYLERAAASVVPLRIGGGTRLKIYEAMAMKVPIVSTSIGAEGLPVKHREHLLIADTAEAQAEAVVEVLFERDKALRMAQSAYQFVNDHCSWDAVAEQFLAASLNKDSA